MFIAVFVITTALHGKLDSFDPTGPKQTLAECQQRLTESQAQMTALAMQFGLQDLQGECRIYESGAI